MATIQSRHIEQPVNRFNCTVKRPASEMKYQLHDGTFHPVQPERFEDWMVLAETIEGARKIAEYHFYQSDSKDIIITN